MNQARDATLGHAQAAQAPTQQQLQQIVAFESSLFTAQVSDNAAGSLQAWVGRGSFRYGSSGDEGEAIPFHRSDQVLTNRFRGAPRLVERCAIPVTAKGVVDLVITNYGLFEITPEGMALPPNAVAELQRDMARLGFVVSQIREIEEARQKRLERQPETGPHAMVRLLARIVGVGVETADMLVHEVLSRPMRDRRAVARYAGLTGAPDESGAQRREQGLARAGNARVRRGMIQLAWRFLMFQKESALALWYRARTADSRSGTRKTMIVALARKLVIALWRFVSTGEPLEGVVLRPAS